MTRLEEIRAGYIDLFAREYRKVVTFVMFCGANIQQAEDAAQEAFITAWREANIPGRWESIRNPEGWIRAVALRKYWREGKSAKRQVALPSDLLAEILEPDFAQMDLTEGTLLVIEAVRSLDPELRPVMTFRLEGFTGPEIASYLGITEQQVRDRLKKARKVLRKTYLAGIKDLGISMQMDQACDLYSGPRPRKLSESGLDKILSVAHHELAGYVDSVAYPARALAAIIEASADEEWAASINVQFRVPDDAWQPEPWKRWTWSYKSVGQSLMRLGAIASLALLACLGIASAGPTRANGQDGTVDYHLAASVATAFYAKCAGINSTPETGNTFTDQCMRLADPALRRQISNSITSVWKDMPGARQIKHIVVLEVTQPLGAPMPTDRITYLSIIYAYQTTTATSIRNANIGDMMLQLINTHGIWLVSRMIYF
jgi:RNA polymerase sigma factor (sigma-70 family)